MPLQTGNSTANWQLAVSDLNHSAALQADGSIWLCGDGYYGQMGNGTSQGLAVFGTIACPFSTVGVVGLQVGVPVLYPNPAGDVIRISNLPVGEVVRVYSVAGELVLVANAWGDIGVGELAAGVYVVCAKGFVWRVVKL